MENQQLVPKRPHMSRHSCTVNWTRKHSDQLFRGLNEQRQTGLFCDIVLVVGDARFPAHRSILAASSEYFNSMFTIGMKETYQREVELVGASSKGCKAVLDFLYGGELSLESIGVYCVLKTAHLLQIGYLVDMCCEYLESEFNADNYLQLQELASSYSLERLDSAIDRFILKNFGMLCSTLSFIEKVPVKKLCLYLDSDQVQLKSEQDLLQVALRWLRYCPERAKEADRVLQNIRFSLIPESDLIDLVKPAVGSFSQQMNCHNFIDEALNYHNNFTAQPVLQTKRTTLRGDGERLLFLGGYNGAVNLVEENTVYFLEPCTQTWILETELPARRKGFCVAVLGNYIFFAGSALTNNRQNVQTMVHRYDPRSRQWTKVASMNHDRDGFYLAALEDRLVAVGGEWMHHVEGGSVEMYNPQTNVWSFVAELPWYICCHAGTTYKQRIFISGGMGDEDSNIVNNLLCYNHCTDTWEEKMHMIEPRIDHGMCTLNDRIYVIGGSSSLVGSPLASVECYNPVCDQWTMVAPLLQPTCNSGVAVWKGQIYVLGGFSNHYHKRMNCVLKYSPMGNNWLSATGLPQGLSRVGACVCVLKS